MRKTIFVAIALVALTSCSGLLALKDSGDASPDATAPDVATDSANALPLEASTDADTGAEDAPEAADDGECSILLSQAQLNLVRGSTSLLGVTLSGSACAHPVPVALGLPSGVTLEGPDSEAGPPFFLFRATAGAALGPARVRIAIGGGGDAPLTILVQDPPGTVDTTFGDAGVVLVKDVRNLTSNGVVVAQDGSIYVSGNAWVPTGCGGVGCTSIVLAKLDGTGAPDLTFGTHGVSVHNGVAPYGDNTPLYLAVAPDAGLRTAGYTSGPNYHSLVGAAFTSAGRPDGTFGAGGFFTRDVGADSKAEVGLLQPDGRFVLGGFAGGSGVIVRTTSQGQLDPSFGDAGVASPQGGVYAMGILSTGALIVGEGWPANQSLIARYSADGALDSTYGDGGSVAGPVSVRGSANLVVEPNDQVVYAGAILGDGGTSDVVALWRFRTDGSLDPAFGDGGIAIAPFPSGSAAINALQRSPDGRYAAAITLTANGGSNSSSSIVAARFTPTGALDLTFGGTGFVNAGLEASSLLLEGVAFDSYGRIVVAGVTVDPDNSNFWDALVVRYWP